MQPVTAAEADAEQRLSARRCGGFFTSLVPGLPQICNNKTTEALVITTLAMGELGAAVGVGQRADDGYAHPGSVVPLIALQDAWVYSLGDSWRDTHLANHELYAPPDSLLDLVEAPFNLEVLKKTEVWLGTLAFLAAGVAVSAIVDESLDSSRVGDDANVFGETLEPAVGYPAAGAIGVGLFAHVAIAEEMLFRGILQSSIARRSGQTEGWIWASAIFGVTHSLNVLALPDDERTEYLLIGVPFITAGGFLLGWVYKHNDYSLAPPTAIHFWYDLLLSATFFALDPTNSIISAKVTLPM